jgi:hypothetical protein
MSETVSGNMHLPEYDKADSGITQTNLSHIVSSSAGGETSIAKRAESHLPPSELDTRKSRGIALRRTVSSSTGENTSLTKGRYLICCHLNSMRKSLRSSFEAYRVVARIKTCDRLSEETYH